MKLKLKWALGHACVVINGAQVNLLVTDACVRLWQGAARGACSAGRCKLWATGQQRRLGKRSIMRWWVGVNGVLVVFALCDQSHMPFVDGQLCQYFLVVEQFAPCVTDQSIQGHGC